MCLMLNDLPFLLAPNNLDLITFFLHHLMNKKQTNMIVDEKVVPRNVKRWRFYLLRRSNASESNIFSKRAWFTIYILAEF